MREYRLNIVLFLIILSNIINMIFPKGMGFEEHTGGWYEVSKYTYGLTIMVMLPTLFSAKHFYFSKMRWMAFLVILYMMFSVGTGLNHEYVDMGSYLKTLMICLSFIFFEETLRTTPHINKNILYAYILSIFINVAYLTLTQNRFLTAVENEGETAGGQGIANSIIYLLPLIAFYFKGRIRIILIIIGLFAVLASLRRTAILAYLLCLPFLYRYLKVVIQKKYVYIMLICVAFITYYVYTNYWFIIEDRFADMTEANEEGDYGSGRTGWWTVLIKNYISSPHYYLQGFGLGSVAHDMFAAGYPYSHAHNDYIEITYTYGLLGLYLWFGTIIDVFRSSKLKALNNYSIIIKMCALSYLLIAIVSGATRQPHFMAIALFSSLMLREKYKHKKYIFNQNSTTND